MDEEGALVVQVRSDPANISVAPLLPQAGPPPPLKSDGSLWRRLPLDRLRAWFIRGGLSILQQAFFAGAHFLANVLLARWLAPASYGAFTLAYSFFLLLLSFHMALFYEPILVYGSGRHAANFGQYIRFLVQSHFVLLAPVCALIGIAAPVVGHFYTRQFQNAFLTLALTAPFLLLIWMVRPLFFAQLDSRTGALAGIGYLTLLVIAIWMLQRSGNLSPVSALIAMAATSLLVSTGCLLALVKASGHGVTTASVTFSQLAADHWRYGRWALLTAGAVWFPANIYYALLPARFGLQSTATLRALMNLMNPLLQTMTALILLLIPILVRQNQNSGLRKMKRTVFQLGTLFLPVGFLDTTLLVVFRVPLLRLLYADRYAGVSAWTILCIGLLPLTGGVIGLFGAALRALEQPRLPFWAHLASTLVALTVGVPVTLAYGVPGAAASLVLGDLPTIVVLAVSFVRCQKAEQVPA